MRKSWSIAAAVSLAVLALIAVALLMRPEPEIGVGTEQARTPTTTATAEPTAAPRASGADSPTAGGRPERKRVPGGVTARSQPRDLQAPPPGPAPKGADLATLGGAPPETLAMLDASAATANSRYRIAFQPYGDVSSGGVVVLVTASEPVGNVEDPYALNDRNVLVTFDSEQVANALTTGGSYRGTLLLRENAGLLTPVLLSAERVD